MAAGGREGGKEENGMEWSRAQLKDLLMCGRSWDLFSFRFGRTDGRGLRRYSIDRTIEKTTSQLVALVNFNSGWEPVEPMNQFTITIERDTFCKGYLGH